MFADDEEMKALAETVLKEQEDVVNNFQIMHNIKTKPLKFLTDADNTQVRIFMSWCSKVQNQIFTMCLTTACSKLVGKGNDFASLMGHLMINPIKMPLCNDPSAVLGRRVST